MLLPVSIDAPLFLNATSPQPARAGANVPIAGWGFDASLDETLFFRVPLPVDSLIQAGDITISSFPWYAAATTGNCRWGFAFMATDAAESASLLTQALDTYTYEVDAATAATNRMQEHSDTIPEADTDAFDDGSRMIMAVRRGAGASDSGGDDTMSGDAILFDTIWITVPDA